MGFDAGHCGYERLAQAVPPQYGQLVFSQACGQLAAKRFGAQFITYDQMLADPARARRTMAFWLRGAGAAEPHAGLSLGVDRQGGVRKHSETAVLAGDDARREASGCPSLQPPVTCVTQPPREAEFRELFYSHAGGYSQQWVST